MASYREQLAADLAATTDPDVGAFLRERIDAYDHEERRRATYARKDPPR